MADDYKVASEVVLGGPYLAQLAEMAAKIEAAEQRAQALKRTLGGLKIGGGAERSAAEFERKIERMEGTVGRAVEGINKRLGSISLGSKPMESVTAFRDNLGTLGSKAGEVGATIRNELVGSLASVRTEAVTVKDAISGWGGEVAAFERRLADLHTRMAEISRQRGPTLLGDGMGEQRSIRHGGRAHRAMSGGVDTLAMGLTDPHAMAGVNVGHVVGDMLKANAELRGEVARYKLAGASRQNIQKGLDASFSASAAVPNVNAAEAFEMMREIAAETGDDEGARAILPDMLRAKTVMQAVTGKSGKQDMLRLFKSIGLRGGAVDEENHKIDVGKFRQEANANLKMIVAGQGLITSNDIQQFIKQAGPMAKGMDPEQLFSMLGASIEDMGGGRTGTAFTAVGRQILGGIMTGKATAKWDKMGLLNEDQYGDGIGWHYNKQHQPVIDAPEKAIKGYDILNGNGDLKKFVEEVIRPGFEKDGVTDRKTQNDQLYQFGGTETSRRLISMFLTQPEMLEAFAQKYRSAKGIGGYDEDLAGQDPNTAFSAVKESIHTLGMAVADAQGVAPGLNLIAKGIAGLANVMHNMTAMGGVLTMGALGASGGLLAYGAKQTMGGFGLPSAAAELIVAAKALEAAAARQGMPHVTPSGVPAVAPGATTSAAAGGAIGLLGRAGQAFGVALVAALAKDVTRIGADWLDDKTGTHAGTKAHDFAFKPLGILGYGLDWGLFGQGAKGLYDTYLGKAPEASQAPAAPGTPDAHGGPSIIHRASGGFVSGPGGPRSDSIPAMLSNGEFVVNAAATERYRGLLESLNAGGDLGGIGGDSGGISRTLRAIDRLADPTDRTVYALMRLWLVLQRIGEAGGGFGGEGFGGGGGFHNASFNGSGGFTSGFVGGGGGSGGADGSGSGSGHSGGGRGHGFGPGANPSGIVGFGANPGAYKPFLDYIAGTEGTAKGKNNGYDVTLANGKLLPGGHEQDLTHMTLDQIDRMQTGMLQHPGNRWNSSAAGRYQIVRKTLRGLRQQLGLKGDQLFDEAMQDRLASTLAQRRGANGSLGSEWASLRGGKLSQAIALLAQVPRGSSTTPGARPDSAVAGLVPGPGQFNGLRLKSDEAIAGGATHAGITDLAREAQSGGLPGGVKHFSSFNDAFHHRLPYDSKHRHGLAFDTSLNDPRQHAAAAEAMRGKLAAAGLAASDFRVIDEYAKLSGHGTGGHIHTQFNSREAADRYHAYAQRNGPVYAAGHGPRDAAQTIDGFRFSGWRKVQHPDAGKSEAPSQLPHRNVPIQANLHVDGRKMASVTTTHQFRQANRPGRGANFADTGRLYPQVA